MAFSLIWQDLFCENRELYRVSTSYAPKYKRKLESIIIKYFFIFRPILSQNQNNYFRRILGLRSTLPILIYTHNFRATTNQYLSLSQKRIAPQRNFTANMVHTQYLLLIVVLTSLLVSVLITVASLLKPSTTLRPIDDFPFIPIVLPCFLDEGFQAFEDIVCSHGLLVLETFVKIFIMSCACTSDLFLLVSQGDTACSRRYGNSLYFTNR
jgi:hypothetical protein